jgi:methionyl aminopeptidase
MGIQFFKRDPGIRNEMIIINGSSEISKIKESGRIIAGLWDILKRSVVPGVSTLELDEVACDHIKQQGGECAFKGYRGYPANLCISVNHEVVHGIPRADRKLKDGDLVGIDVGVRKDGFIADAARSYLVGSTPSSEALKLTAVTKQSLELGIEQARAGRKVVDISKAVQVAAESAGFSVVRELCGHGVGNSLHQEPEIPNYFRPGYSPVLKPGMSLAIEPMINIGKADVKFLSDGWTVVTRDGSLSAHFEDTVIVTDGDPEIVTR